MGTQEVGRTLCGVVLTRQDEPVLCHVPSCAHLRHALRSDRCRGLLRLGRCLLPHWWTLDWIRLLVRRIGLVVSPRTGHLDCFLMLLCLVIRASLGVEWALQGCLLLHRSGGSGVPLHNEEF